MPIEMVPEKGKNVPIVFCDHCGKPIKRAAEGWVVFEMKDDLKDRSEIYFAHSKCLTTFERTRFHGGQLVGTNPLETFPIYLGNAFEIDWKRASETAELLSL